MNAESVKAEGIACSALPFVTSVKYDTSNYRFKLGNTSIRLADVAGNTGNYL